MNGRPRLDFGGHLVYYKKMRMSYKSIIFDFQSNEGGAVPPIRSNKLKEKIYYESFK